MVTLPDELAELLEQESRVRDVPSSDLIREAVANYLVFSPAMSAVQIVGLGESGIPDTSERFDEILVEEEFGVTAPCGGTAG
jgi:hypothetical protein